MTDNKSTIYLRRDAPECRDRFTNDGHIQDDTEIFSPIVFHRDNNSNTIDWLDQYANAHRIAELIFELMRIWLLKIPFNELLNELKTNYVGTTCIFQSERDRVRIQDLIDLALNNNDAKYLIQAYTANASLFGQLNRDLAGRGLTFRFENLLFDRSRDDQVPSNIGQYLFAACLIHHPSVDIYYHPCSRTYRGVNMNQHDLDQYVPGARILTRSFLSTSRRTDVAGMFLDFDSEHFTYPVLCVYHISQNRTALKTSDVSDFPYEEEILIRPFVAFRVERVDLASFQYEDQGRATQIFLIELPSTTERWELCTTKVNESGLDNLYGNQGRLVDVPKSFWLPTKENENHFSLLGTDEEEKDDDNNTSTSLSSQTVEAYLDEIIYILSCDPDTFSNQVRDVEYMKKMLATHCLSEGGRWAKLFSKRLRQTVVTMKQLLERKEKDQEYDVNYLTILFERIGRLTNNLELGVLYQSRRRSMTRELEYESILERRRMQIHIPELFTTLNKHFEVHCSSYIQRCIDLHSHIHIVGIGRDNVEDLVTRLGLTTLTPLEKLRLGQTCNPLIIPLQNFMSCTAFDNASLKDQNYVIHAQNQRHYLVNNTKQPMLIDDSRDLYRLVAETPFLPSSKMKSYSVSSNKSTPIEDILHLVGEHRWIVILGDPGSAKTTLARWLTLFYAKTFTRSSVDDCLPARLPVLVRIGEIANALDRDGSLSLLDCLCQPTWFGASLLPTNDDGKFIREYIQHGHALIILDGLDEIPDFRQRQHIVKLIEQFLSEWAKCPVTFIAPCDETFQKVLKPLSCSHSGNQVIITSRIVGYYMYPITSSHIAHYKLDPLSPILIFSFIDHWFLSVYSALDIPATQSTRAMNTISTLSENLKSMLNDDQEFQLLTSNPMMLSILCTLSLLQINENILHLQKQRICLLDTTSRFVLNSWLHLSDKKETFVRFLGDLAVYLHEQLPSGLLEELDMKNILRRSVDEENIIDDFVRIVACETGLFVPRGLCVYGFLHLTFQEYFVCLRLLRHDDNYTEQHTWEFVASQFRSHLFYGPRFREPLVLALSYISWQWTEADYYSFCSYLLHEKDTEKFNHRMPVGAICLLASISELVRLPSAKILQTALNQCLEASATNDRLYTFPVISGILKKALDVLPIAFVHEWLADANNITIEALGQFVVQINNIPTWLDQRVCHLIHNQLEMSNSRLDNSLLTLVSSSDKTLLPNNDLRQYMIVNEVQVEDIHPLILSIIIALCGGLYRSTTDGNVVKFSPEHMHRSTNISSVLIRFLYSDPQILLNYCRCELLSNSLSAPMDLLIVCCCLDDCLDKLLTLPLIERLQHLAVHIHSLYFRNDSSYMTCRPDLEKLLELLAPLINATQEQTSPYSAASIIIISLSRLLPASREGIKEIVLPYLLSNIDEEQLNCETFILSRSFHPGLIPSAWRRLLSYKDQSVLFNPILLAVYLIELSIDAHERLSTQTKSSITVKSIQETLTFEVVRWISAQIQIADETQCHQLSDALFRCKTFTDIDTADYLNGWLSFVNNFHFREFAYHAAFLLFNINATATIICIELLESELDGFRHRSEKLLCKSVISCWRLGQEGLISLIRIGQKHTRSASSHVIELFESIRLRIEHVNQLNFLFATLRDEESINLLSSVTFMFGTSIQLNFVTKLEQCGDDLEHYITTLLLIFSRTKGKWNKLEVNRGIRAVVHLLRKYSSSIEIANAALAVFTRWNSYSYIKHIIIQSHYPESTRIRAIRWFYYDAKNKNRSSLLGWLSRESTDLIIDTAWEGLVWLRFSRTTYDLPSVRDLLETCSDSYARLSHTLITICGDSNGIIGSDVNDLLLDLLMGLYNHHNFEGVDSAFAHTICLGLMKAQNDPFSTLFDTHLTLAVNYIKSREIEFFRAIQSGVLEEQGFKKALYIISKKSDVCRRLAALRLLVHYGELTIEIAEIFLDVTLEKFFYQKRACELIWQIRRVSNHEVIEYLLMKRKHGSLQRRYMAALLLVQLANSNQISTNTVHKYITDVIDDSTSAYDVYLTAAFHCFTLCRTETSPKGNLNQALAALLMQLSFIGGTHSNDEVDKYSSHYDRFLNCDDFFKQIRQTSLLDICHHKPLNLSTSKNCHISEQELDDDMIELPFETNSTESDETFNLDS